MKNRPPIESLHPGSALLLTVSIFVIAMLWNNPLWLALLLLSVVLTLVGAAPGGGWKTPLAVSLSLAVVYVLVNALFSRSGETILWTGPGLPLIGELRVSLESLTYGLSAGLKIALTVCVFSLYGELMDPDDSLSFYSRYAPRSALLIILTVLLIPRMKRDLVRISGVLRLRGVPCGARGLSARIRSAGPLLNVLLLSSLEGSWDIAAALDCRAFGSGKRSCYSQQAWRPRDWIVALGAAGALLAVSLGLASGRGAYSFYPRLSPLAAPGDGLFLIVVLCCLLAARTLNLGWKLCPFLRSTI